MKTGARTRLASLGVLFLVLATGFLLGVAWDRTEATARAGEPESEMFGGSTVSPGDTGPERSDEGRRERRLIVHRVGISKEQEARVDSIVAIHGARVRELRRAMEEEYDPRFRELRQEMKTAYDPRFQALVQETRSSIRAVLTEEQAVRYDSLLAEHDRREAEKKARHRDEER